MADKIGKYLVGGEEAGNYAGHVKVWSEMAVRGCLLEQNKRTEKLERGLRDAIKALEDFADGIDPELFDEFSDSEDLPKVEAQYEMITNWAGRVNELDEKHNVLWESVLKFMKRYANNRADLVYENWKLIDEARIDTAQESVANEQEAQPDHIKTVLRKVDDLVGAIIHESERGRWDWSSPDLLDELKMYIREQVEAKNDETHEAISRNGEEVDTPSEKSQDAKGTPKKVEEEDGGDKSAEVEICHTDDGNKLNDDLAIGNGNDSVDAIIERLREQFLSIKRKAYSVRNGIDGRTEAQMNIVRPIIEKLVRDKKGAVKRMMEMYECANEESQRVEQAGAELSALKTELHKRLKHHKDSVLLGDNGAIASAERALNDYQKMCEMLEFESDEILPASNLFENTIADRDKYKADAKRLREALQDCVAGRFFGTRKVEIEKLAEGKDDE